MAKIDIKEYRKLASLYGGKALAGTKKQKEWAEKIRYDVLKSSELTDEEKIKLLDVADFVKTSKFWIENREVAKSYFKAENIVAEYMKLHALREEYYEDLCRTNETGKLNNIREEITKAFDSNKFNLKSFISFPNYTYGFRY